MPFLVHKWLFFPEIVEFFGCFTLSNLLKPLNANFPPAHYEFAKKNSSVDHDLLVHLESGLKR